MLHMVSENARGYVTLCNVMCAYLDLLKLMQLFNFAWLCRSMQTSHIYRNLCKVACLYNSTTGNSVL